MNESQPFRVGIVEASPQGSFLIEQLALQPECQLAWYQSTNQPLAKLAQSLNIPTIENWHRFLSDSEWKTVLFLDPAQIQLAQVQDVLEHNVPVGLLPPLLIEPAEFAVLIQNSPGKLFVLNATREEEDFRAVMWLQASGKLESPTTIKRVSWVAKLVEPNPNQPATPDAWFSQHLWEDVDQLLSLTGELPQAVYAAEFSPDRECYFVMLHFPRGVIAHLERRRDSVVPMDIGWSVSGQSAGYANGSYFEQTPAGEIFEIPVELPPETRPSIWETLREQHPATMLATCQHAQNLLKVQRAIQKSSQTGQVASIDA